MIIPFAFEIRRGPAGSGQTGIKEQLAKCIPVVVAFESKKSNDAI
jgi:hypothetical protein